jgi:hypothetical protein
VLHDVPVVQSPHERIGAGQLKSHPGQDDGGDHHNRMPRHGGQGQGGQSAGGANFSEQVFNNRTALDLCLRLSDYGGGVGAVTQTPFLASANVARSFLKRPSVYCWGAGAGIPPWGTEMSL